MSLEVLDVSQTANAVARALSLSPEDIYSTGRFELLRATVWSLASPSKKVHINRVLNVALPGWRAVSGREAASEVILRAELRAALATLEDTGDLIELRGGYWASATARFVELPDGAGFLLVGGIPTTFLQVASDIFKFHGPYRHLAELPAELAAAIPIEDLRSWARLPGVSLQDWAREVVESLERHPYTPTSADVFEFYLPDRSRPDTPQFFRWSESAGDTTGTLLARRRRIYGAREFRLVDVRDGQIINACELHDVDVRRLMYALDAAAENPVRARPFYEGNQTEWRFTSALPRAEQRTFAAFGTLVIPAERRFERRWTFVRNEELALGMLRSLGIVLEQKPRKDR